MTADGMTYLKADALLRLGPEGNSTEVFQPGVVGIGPDGRIQSVGEAIDARRNEGDEHRDDRPDAAAEVTRLENAVLVAGQVNAHSHAFQRAIRGLTEYLPADRRDDDFWSWREAMYRAALALDADQLGIVARQVFAEMLEAGYTTVGEFHYLHHRPDGRPYDNPNELAERMIRAARDVGLRICLLRTAYHRGGHQTPPTDRQRRFVEPDLGTYLTRLDQLRNQLDGFDDAVSVGIAPHSIRACPPSWLEQLGRAARERDLPLHIHVSEQTAELDQSRDEYGTTPIAALDQLDVLSSNVTLVHATHATDEELDLLAAHRPTVCACPSTERNLGDGFLPASELATRNVPVCLGTDSQADIDPWSEMRLVEYHERLRRRARNVLATASVDSGRAPDGRDVSTGDQLWPMGARNGAAALGLETGQLRPSAPADLVALDLTHPTIAGADLDHLAAHLTMSASPDAVTDVWVDGERIVHDGNHPDADHHRRAFEQLNS